MYKSYHIRRLMSMPFLNLGERIRVPTIYKKINPIR